MKNIKLILAAGAFSLMACTNLDVPVDSQYTQMLATPEAIEANMADLYTKFRGTLGRRYMEATCLSSDEYTSVAYKGNWVDGYTYAHSAYHSYSPEDAVLDWMYELGKANVLASKIVNSNYPEQLRYNARAMRAFYTFLMMDMWGDVPIADADYVTEHGLAPDNRHPRAEVAKYIEKELLEIKDHLATDKLNVSGLTDGGNYGRPTKYMALALLAKLYINWPVYTADAVENYDAATAVNEKLKGCLDACKEIIDSHEFALGPDEYRYKFNHDNTARVAAGTVKDFIYAMEYDTNFAQGNQWGRSHSYKDIKSLNPSMFGEFLNNSGGAYITLTPECVDRFNLPGDQRNWMILGLEDKDHNPANGKVYVYNPETLLPTSQVVQGKKKVDDKTVELDLVFTKDINVTLDLASVDVGDDYEGWRQGYRSAKWFLCNADYGNGRNSSNDIPIFRYADILLIKAEALVRKGETGAKDPFNEIRRYVKAPELTGEPTLDDIYMERGREFFDELWRRNDMIRFGHYEDEWFPHYKSNPNANFDKTHRIFPVKKGDLDLNEAWSQNAGY